MIGQTFGHYKVEAHLGSGGMGAVYRAFDTTLQRRVALKILTTDRLEPGHDSLLHEARTASALNHPNICSIFEVAELGDRRFIVMEYLEGKRLAEAIPDGGLPVDTTLRYGIQLAGALAHAHERGVIHRDLKSSNVVVTEDGRVKVLDFGLARLTERHRTPDESTAAVSAPRAHETLVGTLAYMAPEVLSGRPADARSDIWALGVVLYEMTMGRLPFEGRGSLQLTAAILREAPARFSASLPASLRAVILRCLAKEPGERYQRAEAVMAALEAIHSDVVTGPVVGGLAPSRRRLTLAWLVAALLTGVVVLLVLRGGTSRSWVDAIAAGRLQRLTVSETELFDPAISPDGKILAYVAAAEGQFDLFVMRVAGGERVRLTSDAMREAEPRFAPDGESIAFTRRDPTTGFSEVCVIPTFGGEVATVMRRAAGAAWSPDGARIAFIRTPQASEPAALTTARRDGSDQLALLQTDGTYPFLRRPAWSRDGTTLAVVRGTGGIAGEIWLVPAGGGPARRLGTDDPDVFSDDPSFSPDGAGIVHASNRAGAINLWFLPVVGGAPRRLTTGPGPDDSPSVAVDGRVVFTNWRWRHALVLHDLAESRTRVLLSGADIFWSAAFSPDGRDLAFSRREQDGSWHIWTVGLDGSRPRQVTTTPGGEVYARFTPEGEWLLFHSWNRPHVVWRVRRAGGELARITTSPGVGDAFADVSPDGRTVVFTRSLGPAEGIFTMPLGGGEARQLTKTPGSVPRWSPDGQYVAFSGNRTPTGGIYVVRADGSGERRLTTTGSWPIWWPDGRQIGYMIVGVDGNQEIYVVPWTGGTPARLPALRFTGVNYPFDVSPDGSLLATSNAEHVSTEVWLLEPAR